MTATFRRLLLLRHAHADHPKNVRDYDRPLSVTGEQEAGEMGIYMAQENLLPELALVSGARRTRETWAGIQKALPAVVPAIFDDRIYDAEADVLLELLRAVSSQPASLLLVGHNPGLHRLALSLVGRGGRTAYARLQQEFPPASLAVVDFDVAAWGSVAVQSGALERYATPRT